MTLPHGPRSLLIWLGLLALLPWAGWAQRLILDEEFNAYAKELAAPVVPALVPNRAVNYVLVDDPAINAYVTADNLVFIHTGLVRQAPSEAALQGVIAHELAHLALNHHQQRALQARGGVLPVLAGAAVGIGAAIAGAPQAAAAAITGGQAAAIQNMLGYTRVQEREADQLAGQALAAAGLSGEGMREMFSTLRTQAQLSYAAPPPWLVTHPLPAERVATFSKDGATAPPPAPDSARWARVRAKTEALSLSPASVLRQYTDATPEHRYARAIARLRQGRLEDAAELLAPLLAAAPTDPFFLEVQGRIRADQGDLPAAITALEQAVNRLPEALLLRHQLATYQQAAGDHAAAAANFRAITQSWPIWDEPWEGYGRASGAMGQVATAHLAFAEAALTRGEPEVARASLARARANLPASAPADLGNWAASLATRLDDDE